MKILGIDTSSKFLALGLYDGGKIYEYNVELSKRLSSLIIIHLKRALVAAGVRLGDIDYFACGLGPGSFTGIRVGVAVIKGLAWSLNKPVIGISSLDILAMNVEDADKYIVPALDAKRGLIYCSIYKKQRGILRKVSPYMLLSKDEFIRRIKRNTLVFGDAVSLYRESILQGTRGITILDKDYWRLRGNNIIEAALTRIKDKKPKSAFSLRPVYLYPKECQVKDANS